MNLYKLEKERTFEFAKQHFVKRELLDYGKKVQKMGILRDEHKAYLDGLSSKGKRSGIRKGIKKKKKKGSSTDTKKRSDIKSQIQKLKRQKSLTSTIPEETSTDKSNTKLIDRTSSIEHMVEKKKTEDILNNQLNA